MKFYRNFCNFSCPIKLMSHKGPKKSFFFSMNVTELFHRANILQLEEQYQEALELYDEALKLEPENPAIHVKRSTCNCNLGKYREKYNPFLASINDANKCIQYDPNIAEAYYRKGIGLFHEEEYEQAQKAFMKAFELQPMAEKRYNTWLRKCRAELSDVSVEMKDSNSNAMINDESKLDLNSSGDPVPKDDKNSDSISVSESNSSNTNNLNTPGPCMPKKKATRFRYDWYQTDYDVIIDLFAKNIDPKDLSVEILETSLSISIKLENESDFVLDLTLFAPIIASESEFKHAKSKIELKLKKSQNTHWNKLEKEDRDSSISGSKDGTNFKGPAQIYPSSKGIKDWNKIAKSVPEDELSGDAALNKFFQDVYGCGNDDQRRAMMKSFVESGGTVLSTNWKQVSQKKVEGTPPQGLEMRNWNDS